MFFLGFLGAQCQQLEHDGLGDPEEVLPQHSNPHASQDEGQPSAGAGGERERGLVRFYPHHARGEASTTGTQEAGSTADSLSRAQVQEEEAAEGTSSQDVTPKPLSKSAKKGKKDAKKETTMVKGIQIQKKAAKGNSGVTASGGNKSTEKQTTVDGEPALHQPSGE